jgi:hypothetical protein
MTVTYQLRANDSVNNSEHISEKLLDENKWRIAKITA